MITTEWIDETKVLEGRNIERSERIGAPYNRVLFEFNNNALDCPLSLSQGITLTVPVANAVEFRNLMQQLNISFTLLQSIAGPNFVSYSIRRNNDADAFKVLLEQFSRN